MKRDPVHFLTAPAERMFIRDNYDQHAEVLAKKYADIGPRTSDIDLAFSLLTTPTPWHVLELGCGAGRDTTDILRYASHYTGIDFSAKMIELAQKTHPSTPFVIGDMVILPFPPDLDIAFAFASLLHC